MEKNKKLAKAITKMFLGAIMLYAGSKVGKKGLDELNDNKEKLD